MGRVALVPQGFTNEKGHKMEHALLQQRAEAVLPGGVNSPVRAFNSVGGTPIYVRSGKGARLTLADGRECVDCCCSWGAMILGHGDEAVTEAVQRAAAQGTTFGISTPGEIELAERLVRLVGSVEKVRLVNSGTEAVMTAVRLARGVTGRAKILKFEGCYHGHSDAMLVAAGSGVLTAGDGTQVACAGIPSPIAQDTLVVPYNDVAAVQRAFEVYGATIAAVIVEPVAGNMGCVPPAPGFLQALEECAHAHGALLICDEVINAFRFSLGLYSDAIGLHPDLVTMGKVIGGGFPLAAVGGRAEVMDALAPTGGVYQAGTLSGNPVAVAAANVVLARLEREPPYAQMCANTTAVVEGIRAAIAATGAPFVVQQHATVFTPFATTTLPRNLSEAKQSNAGLYAAFFHGMLKRGVYLAPSQFEVNFISAAHGAVEIEKIVSAAKETLEGLSF